MISKERLNIFVVKMGISNSIMPSYALVNALVDRELVWNVSDFYTLHEVPEALHAMFETPEDTKTLLANIERSKGETVLKLMSALGVAPPCGGLKVARAANAFRSFICTNKDIFLNRETTQQSLITSLMNHGITAPDEATYVVDFFRKGENWDTLYALAEAGLCNGELKSLLSRKPATPSTVGIEQIKNISSVVGKRICVTGTLAYGTRGDVFDFIKRWGGIPCDTITRSTDYLVCGTRVGKTKLDKAHKYGIPVISEKELYDVIAPAIVKYTTK